MSRKIKLKEYILKFNINAPKLLLGLFITHLLRDGKLYRAQKLIYKMIKFLNFKTNNKAFLFLEKAIKNVSPKYYSKHNYSKKITEITCGSLNLYKSINLAIKWLLKSAKKQAGNTFFEKIANEIIAASNFLGQSIKKKEEFHKEAEIYKMGSKTIYNLQKRDKKRLKIKQMGTEEYKQFKVRFVKVESIKRDKYAD